MKSQLHRLAERKSESVRSTALGKPSAKLRQRPPPVRYQRYPSLSDDEHPPLVSVRALALLLLVALVIALAMGI